MSEVRKLPDFIILKRIISNNLFMLKYSFKYVPLFSVLHIILQMLFGLFDVTWGIWLMKALVDAVTLTHSFTSVAWILGGYTLYGVTIQAIAAYFYEVYEPAQCLKRTKFMQQELYRKAIAIDYTCYGNPKFYDDFVWATSQSDSTAKDVLNEFASLLKNSTTIVGVTSIMLVLEKSGLLFVGLSFTGVFILNIIKNKWNLKLQEEQKPLDRKRSYIARVFYLIDNAKEIRFNNNIKKVFMEDYTDTSIAMKKKISHYGPRMVSFDFFSNYVFTDFLTDGLFCLLLAFKVIVKKSITYGTFLGMMDGSWSLKWAMTNLATNFARFQNNSLYIDKFRNFIDYTIKIKDEDGAKAVPDKLLDIHLNNVSFTYEGCQEPAINQISMEIKAGQKVAIVGYNGAGKSTLIKLITRLYDTNHGEILYGNENIKNYKVSDYYANFGTVFQDFKLFAATLAQNVGMTDVKLSEDNIIEALEKSEFAEKLLSMPNGINTILTKEFDEGGTTLSGGEAQKVAISRIFYKDSKVLILDEPSAALDPISEYNLNKTMLNATEDKTVIFISHRLSTTKIADCIYLMENGRIIESGSHEELMKQNRTYAKMFTMQSQNYSLSPENRLSQMIPSSVSSQ